MKVIPDNQADSYADGLCIAGNQELAESFCQIVHEFIQRRAGPGLHEIASGEMPGWKLYQHVKEINRTNP